MPAQHGIDVAKGAGSNHIELAVTAFLGRRPVKADGARQLLFREPVL